MSPTKAAKRRNGNQTDPLAEAIASEEAIAQEAGMIRGEATELDAALFLKLWPLLKKPIPAGFIQHVGVVKGKPYESTGVKSLQVLIDRMNNVLTPLWWWHEVDYEDGGKLAKVTVFVGMREWEAGPLIFTQASSYGGVNQASTTGNLYKGSETNAAKRAFAQIGPGHEVYLGATDLDPDVSTEAAEAQTQQAGQAEPEKLAPERADALKAIVEEAGLTEHLPTRLRSFGVKHLTDLTADQAMLVYEWTRGAEGSSDG